MPTSRVPDAIDALVDMCTAASALADVTVSDGPPLSDLADEQQLSIGWSPDVTNAATITQDFASAGARRRDEDFAVSCYAEVRSGDIDMRAVRRAVFNLVAVVEQSLRATDEEPEAPTLRGTVLWAHLTTGDLTQQQTDDGALAGLTFTISCHARL